MGREGGTSSLCMLLLVPPQELGSGPVMRKFLFRLSSRSDGNAFTLPHACGSVPCRAQEKGFSGWKQCHALARAPLC